MKKLLKLTSIFAICFAFSIIAVNAWSTAFTYAGDIAQTDETRPAIFYQNMTILKKFTEPAMQMEEYAKPKTLFGWGSNINYKLVSISAGIDTMLNQVVPALKHSRSSSGRILATWYQINNGEVAADVSLSN